MASRTREITIVDKGGTFDTILKRFSGSSKQYDFAGLSLLRKLLSNEKVKILHTIKEKKPKSLYGLAKILKRDFKSVAEDIKLLEKFGFVNLVKERSGKRMRFKPVLVVDQMNIQIKI